MIIGCMAMMEPMRPGISLWTLSRLLNILMTDSGPIHLPPLISVDASGLLENSSSTALSTKYMVR